MLREVRMEISGMYHMSHVYVDNLYAVFAGRVCRVLDTQIKHLNVSISCSS